MRRRIYILPARYLVRFLYGEWHATNLPRDARLVYGVWDAQLNAFRLVMEAESFDEVPEGAKIPEIALEAEA